jgi:replicative DNA helicase
MAQQTIRDKVPPHNEDAEKAALGAMLLEPDAAAGAVPLIDAEDFYSPANGKIFSAIRSIYDSGGGKKIDIISVCDELQRTGSLDAAGGEAYVLSLTNVVPTAANIQYYIELVHDSSLRRSLIAVASKMSAKAYDVSENSKEILEKAQQYVFELIEAKQSNRYKTIKESIHETIRWMELNLDKEYTGITCGFSGIDYYTSGFQKSEMVVIGARPSIGKTALALNMAANIAVQQKIPAAFFSLEMPNTLLTMRLLAAEAEVDTKHIRTMTTTEKSRNFNKILHEATRVYESPLFIEAVPNMNLFDLRTQARRMREVEKVEIIFIDYIGLVQPDFTNTSGYTPVWEQVSQISRSIKSLARELDIPIVVLSQVGRESEGEKPTLANIRGSGSVEQDADVVILMHRDRTKDKDKDGDGERKPETDFFETEIIVAKNRNGPTGKITLAYYPKWTKFVNYDKRDGDGNRH